jgi:Flp pilus assembly protein CpaB
LTNKKKLISIIIVGAILVAAGVLASLLLIQRFRATQGPVIPEELTVRSSVVVVTRDLSLGDTIAPADVEMISVPVELAPRTALTSLDGAVGKIIKSDMVQGQMVLSHNLADPTNKIQDLSFILSDDHVLLAFPGDDLISREGLIQRGDIVDIFATFKQKVKQVGEVATAEGESPEPQMRTFTVDTLQRVSVTALVLDTIEQETGGNVMQGENQAPASASRPRIRAYLLALNPRDALILKHLKDTDAIFDIVLRAPTSTIQFDLTPVTEEYIIEFYGLEILP